MSAKYKAVKNFRSNNVKKFSGEPISDSEWDTIGKFQGELIAKGLVAKTSEKKDIVIFNKKEYDLTSMDLVDIKKLAIKSKAVNEIRITNNIDNLKKAIKATLIPTKKPEDKKPEGK